MVRIEVLTQALWSTHFARSLVNTSEVAITATIGTRGALTFNDDPGNLLEEDRRYMITTDSQSGIPSVSGLFRFDESTQSGKIKGLAMLGVGVLLVLLALFIGEGLVFFLGLVLAFTGWVIWNANKVEGAEISGIRFLPDRLETGKAAVRAGTDGSIKYDWHSNGHFELDSVRFVLSITEIKKHRFGLHSVALLAQGQVVFEITVDALIQNSFRFILHDTITNSAQESADQISDLIDNLRAVGEVLLANEYASPSRTTSVRLGVKPLLSLVALGGLSTVAAEKFETSRKRKRLETLIADLRFKESMEALQKTYHMYLEVELE
jgi:hypothetical protein